MVRINSFSVLLVCEDLKTLQKTMGAGAGRQQEIALVYLGDEGTDKSMETGKLAFKV